MRQAVSRHTANRPNAHRSPPHGHKDCAYPLRPSKAGIGQRKTGAADHDREKCTADLGRLRGAQPPHVDRPGGTWKLQIMEDSATLVLAKSDQIDFINPEGTPIVYLLEQWGWTDLLDNGDVVVNGPGGMWSASSAWAPTRTS